GSIARTQGFEPCPRALDARCSPRSTSPNCEARRDARVAPGWLWLHGDEGGLVREELRPALDPFGVCRGVRPPPGAGRSLSGPHAGLVGSAVALLGVAPDAGGHAVGPARRSALRARQDVVDGDLAPARLAATVLARVVVALGDVAAAEGHRLARQAVVASQAD